MRVLSFPLLAWLLFAAVNWGWHFSTLYNDALENPALHYLQHATFLAAALLFWWPIIGADPAPWRLPHPVRLFYLFLAMPQNSFLGVALMNARGRALSALPDEPSELGSVAARRSGARRDRDVGRRRRGVPGRDGARGGRLGPRGGPPHRAARCTPRCRRSLSVAEAGAQPSETRSSVSAATAAKSRVR